MSTVVPASVRSARPAILAVPRELLADLLDDESGQDIVEYALLGAVIGIAAIVIWQQLATTVGEVYGETVAPTGEVQTLSSCMPGPDGTGC